MRIRRFAVLAALVLTGLLLQVSILPLVAGGGFTPDLLIVLVVVLTLEHGARTGLWVAGLSGLLADLSAATVPIGSTMLVQVTIAYGIGLLRPYLTERADLTTAIVAGLAGVLAVIGHGALAALLTAQEPPPVPVVVWSSLVVGAFAILLAPPTLLTVRRTLAGTEASTSEVGS
jgi:rod shape-determining protein MreD